MPVMVAAFMAALWLDEKLRPVFLVGAVITFAGLALLTNVFAADARPGFYDLVALGVASSTLAMTSAAERNAATPSEPRHVTEPSTSPFATTVCAQFVAFLLLPK